MSLSCVNSQYYTVSACNKHCLETESSIVTRNRTRTCHAGQKDDGSFLCGEGAENETAECENLPSCADLPDWTEWTSCTITCFGLNSAPGMRTRLNAKNTEEKEQEVCGTELPPCSEDYQYYSSGSGDEDIEWVEFPEAEDPVDGPQWAEWQPCSISCIPQNNLAAVGIRVRIDTKDETNIERELCGIGLGMCAEVSEWSVWEECTESCGENGVQKRQRNCDPVGHEECQRLELEELRECNRRQCTRIEEWSDWSECSEICFTDFTEESTKSRTRTCDGDCENIILVESESCNDIPQCLTEWSSWSECSHTCGESGISTRLRDCNGDEIYCGGQQLSESKECNRYICVEASWSEWTDWDPCVCPEAERGQTERSRYCLNGLPGASEGCQGGIKEIAECDCTG